jgi:hypothetical protein
MPYKKLASVVVVPTPRASLIVSESIETLLDIDDLMVYDIYGTPSSVVGEIVQTSFIDRWEGQESGTRSRSQSCPLSLKSSLQQAL